MNLPEAWAELAASPTASHGFLLRRIAPNTKADVFVGFESPSRIRVFVLVIAQQPLRADDIELGCREFETAIYEDFNHEKGKVGIGIRLLNNDFVDLFDVLINDLITFIGNASDDTGVVARFFLRLERWRLFFQSGGLTGLSETAQRGLYSELLFLHRELLSRFPPQIAIEGWRGPERHHHDFQLGGIAVEVKSTIAGAPQLLSIRNERQLDSSNLQALILYYVLLDVRVNDGKTLPDIVEEIDRTLERHPSARDTFHTKLFEAGYSSDEASRYDRIGYFVRDDGYLEVREGFPRIIEGMLPLGIARVRYSVTLSSCVEFTIDKAAFAKLLVSGKAAG